MSNEQLPPANFYATLPRVLAAAGALFRDPAGRVLLVQPAYRTDTWLLPGGAMDPGEYPWETARREVREEIGLELQPGRLLGVDWVPARDDGRPPLIHFIFDGGVLTETDAERSMHLQPDELTAWRLCTPTECDSLLLPRVARRIHACVAALRTGQTAYLQHGWSRRATSG
ncbi:NUDIX hydrolase [Frankia sp. Cr2]|uniref:NUDIX hydrolase n=1 Tax=Frankia sp. Cr2 TaxID=3073932 RepID=UPI002AD376B4|nr:NUDIX hydrolase [Frankia sp. Cr2]